MESVVTEYLSYLNISISKKYFNKCVLSHPDYPSLLCIADTLQQLGINHQIGKIEREHLGEVSFPYILQIDKEGSKFLLIKTKEELAVYKSDLNNWDGVVIKAEPTENITDEEHNKKYAEEKLQRKLLITLGTALLGLIFVLSVTAGISWLHLLLLATSISGAAIGYLLLARDLGITYKPVESFCNAGKRTNCDRILNAEDANLFGSFTFTDAAVSYFVFQLIIVALFIPLAESSASFWWPLAAAALLTVPVIGYSLYYQYVKAQTWCRLCVIVDAILGIQLPIFAIIYYEQIFVLADLQSWPVVFSLLLFAAIISSILLFKGRLETANDLSRSETIAKRVKQDPEVFTHLLLQEERKDIKPFKSEIIIGNSAAPVKIIMVVNLYCHPCRQAFKTVQQLTRTYPDKVCFCIRILNSGQNRINGLSASTYLINYWRHHIYKSEDESISTQNLIRNWYENINPNLFKKLYPEGELTGGDVKVNGLAEKHYRWIKENKITRTPTFLINGYPMPGNYSIKDFMPMMSGLAALFTEMNQQPKLQNQTLVQKQEG